jgi:hypothetical protein
MIGIKGGPTRLRPYQIELSELFTVKRILASRGFQIRSEGDGTDTLLARDPWTWEERDLIFMVFDDAILRKDLLTAIEDSSSASSYQPVSNLLALPDFQKHRNRFSTTFEWYVGELLVRKFQAFSSSFGVKVENVVRNTDNGTAGDFDVLTVLGDMNLLYLECKTGRCTQNSISNTIGRSLALHSVASVIFLEKGTSIGNLIQLLKGLDHPIYSGMTYLLKLNIKGFPDSVVYEWHNCYFVLANETSGTVELKLQAVMRLLVAHRSTIIGGIKPGEKDYVSVGYDYSEINL